MQHVEVSTCFDTICLFYPRPIHHQSLGTSSLKGFGVSTTGPVSLSAPQGAAKLRREARGEVRSCCCVSVSGRADGNDYSLMSAAVAAPRCRRCVHDCTTAGQHNKSFFAKVSKGFQHGVFLPRNITDLHGLASFCRARDQWLRLVQGESSCNTVMYKLWYHNSSASCFHYSQVHHRK